MSDHPRRHHSDTDRDIAPDLWMPTLRDFCAPLTFGPGERRRLEVAVALAT
jgi:hypothetical protein